MAQAIFRRLRSGPNQPLRINPSHPLAKGLGIFGWGIGVNRIWDALGGKVVDLSAAGSATGTFTRGAGDNGPTLRMAGGERGGGSIYNPTSLTLGQGTLAARFKPREATSGATRPYVVVANASLGRGLMLGMAGSTSSHAWGVVSSSGWIFASGGGVDEQAWRTVATTVDPSNSGNLIGWHEGRSVGAAGYTGTSIVSDAPTRIWFGRDNTGYFGYPTGDVGWFGYWHRILNAAEHRLLHEDAWSLVAPASLAQGWRFAAAGGVTNYTLTADAGAFSLTGTPTGFLRGIKLAADAQSYALTGIAAGFTYNRPMTASVGTFTLTGQAAGLTAARILVADPAAFTLSGLATGLLFGHYLAADAASLTLTGTATGLVAARLLAADLGAVTLTGVAAGLTTARRMDAALGVFALTGADAGLTYAPAGGYILSADAAAFTFASQDAALLASLRLSADAATFSLAGQPTALLRGLTLAAGTGSFTLTGVAAGTLRGRVLAADVVTFALTGIATGLTYTPAGSYTITANSGAFALTGIDAAFLRSVVMTAAQGSFVLTGQAASLLAGGVAAPDPRRTVRLLMVPAWPAVRGERVPPVRMGRKPIA